MKQYTARLLGEEAMVAFGSALGKTIISSITEGTVVFLEGDLGMGKTTLSRGVLFAYGHKGVVKSPTYTLVEPYEFADKTVYHFDLYRLGDPEELEYMGVRDYFDNNQLCLVEWAEKAQMFLPRPDIVVRIEPISGGRELHVIAHSNKGDIIIGKIAEGISEQAI